MSNKLTLKIIENGPIAVSGYQAIHYCGEKLESTDTVYLCRCGDSQNPPFCDGSHSKNGFSGDNEQLDKAELVTWEGVTLRTQFNKNVCMHAFYCKPLKVLRERELDGDSAAADEIKKVIATCPSGALAYEEKSDNSMSEFEDIDCVDIMEGGEIRIQSAFECDGLERQQNQPANRMTLCRCGLSKNKPFCDGKHRKKNGFV